MGALLDIVFDCTHPASLARFWAATLDGYEVAPYDRAELDRLAAIGVADPEDDPAVLVASSAGPRLWFQRVPERKAVKNRIHLDVAAVDRAAEVRRLMRLGASVVDDGRGAGSLAGTVVMADPEGNEFCVVSR